MSNNFEYIYRPEIKAIVHDRPTEEYCSEAKELICAAKILEKELDQTRIFFKSKLSIIPNSAVAETLADWFRHKAARLDLHCQIWDYEQAHPTASITVDMPVPSVEAQFSDALKTAREVIRAYEEQAAKPESRNPFRKIFRRSGNR